MTSYLPSFAPSAPSSYFDSPVAATAFASSLSSTSDNECDDTAAAPPSYAARAAAPAAAAKRASDATERASRLSYPSYAPPAYLASEAAALPAVGRKAGDDKRDAGADATQRRKYFAAVGMAIPPAKHAAATPSYYSIPASAAAHASWGEVKYYEDEERSEEYNEYEEQRVKRAADTFHTPMGGDDAPLSFAPTPIIPIATTTPKAATAAAAANGAPSSAKGLLAKLLSERSANSSAASSLAKHTPSSDAYTPPGSATPSQLPLSRATSGSGSGAGMDGIRRTSPIAIPKRAEAPSDGVRYRQATGNGRASSPITSITPLPASIHRSKDASTEFTFADVFAPHSHRPLVQAALPVLGRRATIVMATASGSLGGSGMPSTMIDAFMRL